MDKVLSARLDEDVLRQLEFASRKLGMTKKQFLEEAIRLRARASNAAETLDVLQATFGGWRRDDETIDETIASIRRSRHEEELSKTQHFESLHPRDAG